MAVHVVTVGVSVLSNASRAGVLGSMDIWDEDALPEPGSEPAWSSLVGFVASDPWRASAELHAMQPYLESGAVDEVHLITTSTRAAALVADVLAAVLRQRWGLTVSGRAGPLGDVADPEERFATSLHRLHDWLLEFVRVRTAEGKEVWINATGGLKPELAVCLVVGNVTGVPVYYRHERGGGTVVLPTLVWPLCPTSVRGALRALAGGPLTGADAARFFDEHRGARLERLRLLRVDRDARGEVRSVALAPYGRLLLDLAVDAEDDERWEG